MKRRAFGWHDLDQLVELGAACREADGCGTPISADSLRTSLAVPGRDPERTSVVVEDEGGRLVAATTAWPTSGVAADTIRIGVQIHPDRRSPQAFAELLLEAEGRGIAAYVPSGKPAEIHISCHERPTMWREVVESAGFAPVRWFIDMARSLDRDWPPVKIPNGITLRTLSEGIAPLSLKHALDEAFLDHWNPAEFTDEQFLHYARSTQFRADLSLVAVDADGTVAGGLVGGIHDDQDINDAADAPEGRVEVLGVRRAHRNRGLGRALLTTAFSLMTDAGMKTVSLDVDAENPTGATGLYASVGFVEKERITVYSKAIAPAM